MVRKIKSEELTKKQSSLLLNETVKLFLFVLLLLSF